MKISELKLDFQEELLVLKKAKKVKKKINYMKTIVPSPEVTTSPS